jgi:hypothetical protein
VNLGYMYCFGSATGFTGLKPQIGDPNLGWPVLSEILATGGDTLSALSEDIVTRTTPRAARIIIGVSLGSDTGGGRQSGSAKLPPLDP